MAYDFDKIIDRRGTENEKWDGLKGHFGSDNLLPLWIADMDFAAPECISEAVQKRAAHPIYGYPSIPENHYDSFIAWEKRHMNWDVKPQWLGYVPGVVGGVAAALMGFTAPGDGVVIMPPVYHPFRNTLIAQGRKVVNSPMKLEQGRYEVDFDDLAAKAKEARAIILCSPHNPTGRCFSREELLKIEAICRENSLMVIADEIHSDIVFSGHRHIPFATVSDWAREHSVTLMAPSKTFNIAGLVASIYIVPNANLHTQMDHIVKGCMHMGGGNVFALIASRAAYAGGEEWYQDLLKYLEGNVAYLETELAKRIPQIRLIHPEATYIPLLDCRDLNMPGDALQKFMLEKAKVAMNEGTLFGAEGEGFCRINIATPRAYLEEFISRVEKALKNN